MNFEKIEAIFTANTQNFKAAVSEMGKSIDSFQKSTGDKFEKTSALFNKVGKGLSVGLTAPLAALGGMAVNTALGFDSQMSKVQAISNATAEEFKAMEKTAREVGASTKYTAQQSAEGMEILASAGLNASENMAVIKDVANLATVANDDFNLSANAIVGTMKQFGLETEQASHISDVFAEAQGKTAAQVDSMAEAMSYAGTTASSLGISFEETAAALGVLHDAQIKGGRAGTTLNAIFTAMQRPTEQAKKVMDGLGISFYDADGNMKPFAQNINELRDKTANLTKEQKSQALSTIFGTQAMVGLNALLNETPGKLEELTEQFINAEGSAKKMSDMMSQNLKGTLAKIQSGAQELLLTIADNLVPKLEILAQGIQNLIERFNGLSEEQKATVVNIGLFLAAIGPTLLIISKLANLFKTLSPVLGIVGKSFSTVGSIGLSLGKSLMTGLGGALKFLMANPIVLLIAGITALVGTFIYLWKTNENFRNFFINIWKSLATFFTNVINMIKEIASNIWEGVSEIWQNFVETVKSVWQGITEFFSNIFSSIKEVALTIWEGVAEAWTVVVEVIKAIWQGVLEFFSSLWEGIKVLFAAALLIITALITGDWELLGEVIQELWNRIKETIVNVWEGIKEGISNAVTFVSTWISEKWGALTEFISNLWNSLKETTVSLWNGIKEGISTAVSNAWAWIVNTWNAIPGYVSGIWSSAKESTVNLVSGMVSSISTGFSRMVSAVVEKGKGIASGVRSAFSSAISSAKQFPSQAVQVGRNLILGFVDGVKQFAHRLVDSVKNAVGNAIQGAKNLLGIKSPSRVFKGFGRYTMLGFAIGADRNAYKVNDSIQNMYDGIERVVKKNDINFDIFDDINGLDKTVNGLDLQATNTLEIVDDRGQDEQEEQPMEIKLQLGEREYKAYCKDVYKLGKEQEKLKLIKENN